ncbi:MAG: hypothetical protein KAI70_08255, partial [Candidatus Omnitrophica bacterium]|nr:hypothetical protein [Candidatus Omnitrophota bacterium]
KYSCTDIINAFDGGDIKRIIAKHPKIFPEIYLMLTIFGQFGPVARINAGNKLKRLITTLVESYPGSVDVENPEDLPIKILACTDDNDQNLFGAFEDVFGEGAELEAYKSKLIEDVTPDEGENYGKYQPKLTMKPNLNAKAVAHVQYWLGKYNLPLPGSVELVDEEDILQPLLLISKMCVMNMRKRAVREQIATGITDERDKKGWNIDIEKERPKLNNEFDLKVKTMLKYAGINEKEINIFMDTFEENIKGMAGKDKLVDIEGSDDEIRRLRRNLSEEDITASEERKMSTQVQFYELERRRVFSEICSEQNDAEYRAKYQLWVFVKSLTYDIKTGNVYYQDLLFRDIVEAARKKYVENEFEIRSLPDVIQTELRHITMKMPTWEKNSFVDYFAWHRLIQKGQTATGFLFLGGTGNSFSWENLAGTQFVFNDEGKMIGESPLSWRAELALSYKHLRETISTEESRFETETGTADDKKSKDKRISDLLKGSDEKITKPSRVFFETLNDLQLAGVWDGYNQIEDAERGSRLVLHKLLATRLEGNNLTQILEDLLPALGEGWLKQRERWITLQAFWAINSYRPVIMMFIGQLLMAGFTFYVISAAIPSALLSSGFSVLVAIGGGFFGYIFGGMMFYSIGTILYRIMEKARIERNVQWQQSPFRSMGGYGIKGWLKGYWLYQHVSILAAPTILMLMGGITMLIGASFGISYYLNSIMVLKISGLSLVTAYFIMWTFWKIFDYFV